MKELSKHKLKDYTRKDYLGAYNAMRREKQATYARIYNAAHKEESAARHKVYYAKHRKEILAKQKAWGAEHKKERSESGKVYYGRNKKKHKAWRLMHDYGLSQEAFDNLLYEQGGGCAICKKLDWAGRQPLVDHEHGKKMVVRGLLCQHCNVALGHIGDDPIIARAMADYLEKPKEKIA